MKKVIIALMAAVLSAPAFAQYSSGGFSLDKENLYYGIRIGLTGATINGDASKLLDNKSLGTKVGMTLGGVVGLRVSDTTPLFLESGLYYTERGAKKDSYKVSLNYLELPLLIKYGIKATDDIAVLPFIGPYFGYAISGRSRIPGMDGSMSSFRKGGFKHADMGFKLGAGAEYNKLYLELGYQFGVANISDTDGASARTGAFFANFGVNF